MSGVDVAVYELRMRLFRNHSAIADLTSKQADYYRAMDALQAERETIMAEFLELGLTPEEVLWDA